MEHRDSSLQCFRYLKGARGPRWRIKPATFHITEFAAPTFHRPSFVTVVKAGSSPEAVTSTTEQAARPSAARVPDPAVSAPPQVEKKAMPDSAGKGLLAAAAALFLGS